MPEFECSVAKVHRRSYGVPQSSLPVCCGKPMLLMQDAPQPAASAQPETAESPRPGLVTSAASTIPQKERNWWQLWK